MADKPFDSNVFDSGVFDAATPTEGACIHMTLTSPEATLALSSPSATLTLEEC